MKRKNCRSHRLPSIDRLEPRSYLTAASFTAPTFASGVDNVTGIAAGDLTGNGQSDIVVAGTSPTASQPVVGVYLSGDGAFSAAPTLITLSGGTTTAGVAVGDFSNNGFEDIAVVNSSDNVLDVLLNDGKGNFNAGGIGCGLGGSGGDTQIAVGDFTDNGISDVAVVDPNDNQVGTYLCEAGYTTGYFVAGGSVSVNSPTQIAVGDFNNDGYDDLAILSSSSPNSVMVALNNQQGGFDAPVSYPVGNNIGTITGIAVGDFNGTNNPDIVVTGTQAGTNASVVAVLPNQGNGTFGAATATTVTTGASIVLTSTFTGSGSEDIASISSTGALDVLPGNGNGTFGADQQVFSNELTMPGTQAVVGDFNADSRPDIAFISTASTNTFGVILNNTGGTITPPPFTGTPSALVPKVLGPIPGGSIVAGVKLTPIHEKVELTNTGSTAINGPVSLSLLLSSNATGSSGDPTAAAVTIKRLTLKPHQSKTETLTIKSLPASSTGSLYLVALVTDPTHLQNAAASSKALSVVPATVDLTGTFTDLVSSAVVGQRIPVAFNIVNDGSVAASGPLLVKIYMSEDGLVDANAIALAGFTGHHVNIKPGKPLKVRLTETIPKASTGKYQIIVQIDPNDTFHESNTANNTIIAPAPGLSVS